MFPIVARENKTKSHQKILMDKSVVFELPKSKLHFKEGNFKNRFEWKKKIAG